MLIVAWDELTGRANLRWAESSQHQTPRSFSKQRSAVFRMELKVQLEDQDEVNEMMKIMIGYDGSAGSDAALYDLQRAGLPDEAEALVVSVADVMMSPAPWSDEITEQALMSRRVSSGLLLAQKQSARVVLEAKAFANRASERLRSHFPNWHVSSQEP